MLQKVNELPEFENNKTDSFMSRLTREREYCCPYCGKSNDELDIYRQFELDIHLLRHELLGHKPLEKTVKE